MPKIPAKLERRARASSESKPYSINARLPTRHYAVLLYYAELHDCGVSEALRLVLEQHVDEMGEPPLGSWDRLESIRSTAAEAHADDD